MNSRPQDDNTGTRVLNASLGNSCDEHHDVSLAAQFRSTQILATPLLPAQQNHVVTRRTFLQSASLAVSASCLSLSGCPWGKSEPVGKPLSGVSLEIASPAAWKLADFWEVLIGEWEAQTGAVVNFSASSMEVPSHPQLAFVANDQLTAFDEKNLLSPFEPVDSTGEPQKLDILNGLKQRLATRNQRLIALPISQPVYLLYYRRDLLEKAGLKAPQSWSDYENLLTSQKAWANGLSIVEPWSEATRSTWFHTQLVPLLRGMGDYSVWFEIGSGASRVSQPVANAIFARLARRWEFLDPVSAQLTAVEARAKVLKGEAAMAIGYEPVAHAGISATIAAESPSLELNSTGEIAVAPIPATAEAYDPLRKTWLKHAAGYRPALVGFDGWSLTFRHSQTQTLGALSSLLELLIDLRADEAFPGAALSLTRESQLTNLSQLPISGLNAASAGEAFDSIAQALRANDVTTYLPVLGQEIFIEATQKALGQWLEKPAQGEAAAQQLVDGFAAGVASVGAEQIQKSYRRSLGLLAD
ncbi:extracellular solute-binding protein [Planctopirus hydrillae]|uniref:extracellular solute-binding protein n=1 Tax=Planctopirus hydrillae TaxID=1841610 RepID=UPI0013F4F274|nr:extracellular solute-binding protein [Planctopirus hydrillae]